jgi:hypothetical protein
MSEPVLCVEGRDGFHDLLECGLKSLAGAGFRRSQGRLDLTQAQLHGRQVRRVWWYIEQPSPVPGQRLLDARYFVDWPVVQHDAIARSQGGPEHLPHVSPKDIRVGGALHGHHGLQPLDAEGAQPRDIRPIVQRDRAMDPLSVGGPAIPPGHRQIDAGFINKFHAPEIERGRPVLEGGTGLFDLWGVTFGGVKGLFFRGSPRRWRTRHMVATLRRSPRWRCS